MRTTVTLSADAAAIVERVRRERGIGVSEAINELVRAGAQPPAAQEPFVQPTVALGLRIDVASVADAVEQLDGPASP